jgi:UDP:flavonoid glycosyltransferase YjiC (YdhE family)
LRRDLSAKRLADAIHGVASDESYRRSAERVGAALGAEDGVANAVDVIRAIVSPPH